MYQHIYLGVVMSHCTTQALSSVSILLVACSSVRVFDGTGARRVIQGCFSASDAVMRFSGS